MSKVRSVFIDDLTLEPFISVIENRHDYISVRRWISAEI